jgi:hypothetical protein
MNSKFEPFLKSIHPYVAYNAAKIMNSPEIGSFKRQMLSDTKIAAILSELKNWPGPSLSSHKSAQQFFHKLAFLADIGFTIENPDIKEIIDRVVLHRDESGIPQLPMTISKAYGGTGEQLWGWALCDAPTTLYALVKMGYLDEKTKEAINYLSEKTNDSGWGCTVSKDLGSWRGPGKKGDPCPYATLIMTKLLIQHNPKQYEKQINQGANCLLKLWETSREQHPYIFYMGNDFRKLKLPFIWYDILHVVDVLSQIPSITNDKRFKEMLAIIVQKEKADIGFTPESVYLPWKEWDFGQKSNSSDWLSFCVRRIQLRITW